MNTRKPYTAPMVTDLPPNESERFARIAEWRDLCGRESTARTLLRRCFPKLPETAVGELGALLVAFNVLVERVRNMPELSAELARLDAAASKLGVWLPGMRI